MKWRVIVVVGVVALALLLYVTKNSFVSRTDSSSNVNKSSQISNYLESLVNFAHEGYLADEEGRDINGNNATDLMSATLKEMNHGKQAISFLSDYASSTDSNISSTAKILALSEANVISRQQQGLDMLRQFTNGIVPTDMQYTMAQMQVAASDRNDNIILVSTMLPGITMDIDSMSSSSTATVGPLDPSGVLSPEDKSAVNTTLQVDFGESLNSNENDIFLVLAQEISLLLNSPTYADFHDAWVGKMSGLTN